MTNLTCGWCYEGFDATLGVGEKTRERHLLICPYCARLLPCSKKVSTGDLVGQKHFHTEWKNGDIVT